MEFAMERNIEGAGSHNDSLQGATMEEAMRGLMRALRGGMIV